MGIHFGEAHTALVQSVLKKRLGVLIERWVERVPWNLIRLVPAEGSWFEKPSVALLPGPASLSGVRRTSFVHRTQGSDLPLRT